MPLEKLRDFLDANGVRYEVIRHPLAYTAQRIAASARISGKNLAKTIMVKVDGRLAMAVLPASYRVSVDLLRDTVGAHDVEIATEREFKDVFPGCDIGAMPPFGNLWNLSVFVAEVLTDDDEIAFNAGSHTELVRMSYQDFERLVSPTIVRMALGPF